MLATDLFGHVREQMRVGLARTGSVEEPADEQRAEASLGFEVADTHLLGQYLGVPLAVNRTYLVNLAVGYEVWWIHVARRRKDKIARAMLSSGLQNIDHSVNVQLISGMRIVFTQRDEMMHGKVEHGLRPDVRHYAITRAEVTDVLHQQL